MIRLAEVIRQVLGTQHITSTSDEDESMDHDLFRRVLQSLQAHNIHIPEDVRVVISTTQAYLHSGVVDDKNLLANQSCLGPFPVSTRLVNEKQIERIIRLAVSISE